MRAVRYVVYGAGAVGGVIAARLHLAGIGITVVARGEHLEHIRRTGLVLDSADRRLAVPVTAAGSASEVSWTEDTVVVLTVKSHQTAAALEDLGAHAPPEIAVLCAQNGVANEAEVLRRFAATYAVCVMLPALHLEPGVVVQKCHPTPGILDLGRFPDGVDALTGSVAGDLRRAGFESLPRADIMAWKYRKLLVNAVGDVAALFPDREQAASVAERVGAEGRAVLAAAGIGPVSQEEDDERRGGLLQSRPDIGEFAGNSLAQSLGRGIPTEIHYRVGELVLLGRLHGVATPACELVQRAALEPSR